jgi:hypothetical protein
MLSRPRWRRGRVEVALFCAILSATKDLFKAETFTSFRAAALRPSRARFLSGVIQQQQAKSDKSRRQKDGGARPFASATMALLSSG